MFLNTFIKLSIYKYRLLHTIINTAIFCLGYLIYLFFVILMDYIIKNPKCCVLYLEIAIDIS